MGQVTKKPSDRRSTSPRDYYLVVTDWLKGHLSLSMTGLTVRTRESEVDLTGTECG